MQVIDRGAESESGSTSDNSSKAEPDAEPFRKDSTDSGPMDVGVYTSLRRRNRASIVPVISCNLSAMSRTDSPIADSLASSIAKGDASENTVKRPPYDTHMNTISTTIGVVILSLSAAAVYDVSNRSSCKRTVDSIGRNKRKKKQNFGSRMVYTRHSFLYGCISLSLLSRPQLFQI